MFKHSATLNRVIEILLFRAVTTELKSFFTLLETVDKCVTYSATIKIFIHKSFLELFEY